MLWHTISGTSEGSWHWDHVAHRRAAGLGVFRLGAISWYRGHYFIGCLNINIWQVSGFIFMPRDKICSYRRILHFLLNMQFILNTYIQWCLILIWLSYRTAFRKQSSLAKKYGKYFLLQQNYKNYFDCQFPTKICHIFHRINICLFIGMAECVMALGFEKMQRGSLKSIVSQLPVSYIHINEWETAIVLVLDRHYYNICLMFYCNLALSPDCKITAYGFVISEHC